MIDLSIIISAIPGIMIFVTTMSFCIIFIEIMSSIFFKKNPRK